MIELASCYVESHDISQQYARSLKRVAVSMEAAGVCRDTIDSVTIDRWLTSLPFSRTTKINYRRMALTLLRWGAETGRCRSLDRPPMRVKPDKKITEAWTRGEVKRLLATAAMQTGHYQSGCQKDLFWLAFVAVSYECGLRTADTYGLKVSQLHGTRLYAVHAKTGVAAAKVITPDCAALLGKIAKRGDGKTIFRWALSRKHFFLGFKKLAKEAGLHGTIKWLRRSGATHCEAVQPGSASRFLGHISGQALAAKSYIDWTQLSDQIPRPPAILNSTG